MCSILETGNIMYGLTNNKIKFIIAFLLIISMFGTSCKENDVEENREAYEEANCSGDSCSGTPKISSPSPSDSASVTVSASDTYYTLRANVSGATSCTIYYDDDSAIDYQVSGTISGSTCSVNVTFSSSKFTDNGTNYWYVKATNSSGTTRYPTSGTLSFSISKVSLPIISSPSPSNSASVTVSTSDTYYTLRANVSGATSCTIYYDDDSVIDYQVSGTISGSTCSVNVTFSSSKFTDNGTNYWYVKATNSSGTTRYPTSGNLYFDIAEISMPSISNPSPSDSASVTVSSSDTYYTLSADVSGATSCIIYYDDDSGISFQGAGTISGGTCSVDVTFSSGKFTDNGTNYWYVEATNSSGTTRYPTSGTLSFSISETSVPTISSPSPSDSASVTVSSSDTYYTLRADVSGATSCTIYYDDDSSISYQVYGTISGSTCSINVTFSSGKFTDNGTNYWYVEATNSSGTTRYPTSGLLSFDVTSQ
jgi:hypothetical protein